MKSKLYYLTFLLAVSISSSYAQVAIGVEEKAEAGSLLQVKTKEGVPGGDVNSDRGVGLSRVELIKKDQLFPMFGKPGGPITGNYDTNKAQMDKDHIGLTVYNLTDDPVEDLCPGVHVWDGNVWIRVPEPCCAYIAIGEDGNKYTYYCEDFPGLTHDEALNRCNKLGDEWHLMTFQEFDQIFGSDSNLGIPAFDKEVDFWVRMNGADNWSAPSWCPSIEALHMMVRDNGSGQDMRYSFYYGERVKNGTAVYPTYDPLDPNYDICSIGIGMVEMPVRAMVRCVRDN